MGLMDEMKDAKNLSGPMGLVTIGVLSLIGMVLLFGLTAFYYFIKFMKSDLMQTGIPIWVLLLIGFIILIRLEIRGTGKMAKKFKMNAWIIFGSFYIINFY